MFTQSALINFAINDFVDFGVWSNFAPSNDQVKRDPGFLYTSDFVYPEMTPVSELILYFDDILDMFVIPNTFNLSLPKVKSRTGDSIIYTIDIKDRDTNATLNSGDYILDQFSDQAFFIIKNFKKGSTLRAYMTAFAGSYKTYAIFDIYVFCGDFCKECSLENTCDICEDGYELDSNLQCVAKVENAVNSNLFGIASQVMTYGLLAIGGLSLSINPNFWTLVNAMQIMRTITLLKINMPLSI